MGNPSARSGDRDQNEESADSDSVESSSNENSTGGTQSRPTADRETPRGPVRALGSVQRSASVGGGVGTKHPGGPAGSGYVNYDAGPDHEGLSARYGLEFVKDGQAAKVQRLEKEFGGHRVYRWVQEGMTVETMGKPRDMQAFRERQAQRPGEVPRDVERRNEASLQRSLDAAESDGPAGEAGVSEAVRSVISSPGHSLDEPVQREMGSKLGEDFSDVRIHTGPQAAAAAESINARAFTVGNHVAFNRGEYDPESTGGKEVLAHELTHVRQQADGRVSMLPKTEGLEIDPDPTLEKEAEQTAQRVVDEDEKPTTVHRMGTEIHLQRLPETSTVGTSTGASGSGTGGLAVQRQSAAADSAGGDGAGPSPGENVAETHEVEEGETLAGIAASYGIENWRKLWYQNVDVVGDQPNLLFPGQLLEIPEDEDAVPEQNITEAEGEMTPAPRNDMRTDKPEQTPPEAPADDEEALDGDGEQAPGEGVEPEPETQSEVSSDAGPGKRAIGADEVTGIGDIPETKAEAPASSAADPTLQETLAEVDAGVDEVVTEDVGGEAGETKAPDLADNAKEASEKPQEESDGEDETEHVSILDDEQRGAPDFDKGAFKETLEDQVDEVTPETIEDVDGFGDDDSLDDLEAEMEQEVSEEKESTEAPVREETENGPPNTPDDDEDVPLEEPERETALEPDAEAASAARPERRSREEVEQPLDDVKQDLDDPLEDEEFDEQDMAGSPHEEFSEPGEQAQDIKQDAEQTKGEVRQTEMEHLTQAEATQAQTLAQTTTQLNQQREGDLEQVGADQREAKSEDESVRQEVFSKVNEIYEQTEQNVTDCLEAMEADVQEILDGEFAAVRAEFEEDVEEAKDKSTGFASWFKRTFWLGDDMNENFEHARQNFIQNTKARVIDRVADRVAQGMKEVGEAIRQGQHDIEEYLNSLPEERQQVAQEAAQLMSEKFAGLQEKAQQTKQAISSSVIDTYERHLDEVQTELAEAKEEVEEARWSFKPGFVKIIEDIAAAFTTLIAAVSNTISSAPTWSELFNLDFGEVLGNIRDTVGDVFDHFMDWGNVIKSMFSGLLQWLGFDNLVDGFDDIRLPEGLTDVGGITAMGWDLFKGLIGGDYLQDKVKAAWKGTINIGGRIGKVNMGEAFFQLLEGGTDVIDSFADAVKHVDESIDTSLLELAKGVGLFGVSLMGGAVKGMKQAGSIIIEEIMKSNVVNLLDAVLEAAVSFVTTQVIKAAVSKLKALAGPVGAALKLVEKVYKFVMFIIDNAARYIGLIQSFAQFVFGIIKGATSRAANLLIDGLTAALPMLFDFIAKAIAGTGVSEGIRGIFMTGKEKVDEFFDWAIEKLEPVLKPITKVLYPVFFGAGLTAEDDEEADEESDSTGGESGALDSLGGESAGDESGAPEGTDGQSETADGVGGGETAAEPGNLDDVGSERPGGQYENLDDMAWNEMTASQKATYAMDQGTTMLEIGMGEKVRITDPETGEKTVVDPSDLDQATRDRLDQASKGNLKYAEAASAAGDIDVDIAKIDLEAKMYAVDLTVLAEEGSIGSDDARQILVASGLRDVVEENELNPVEFVQSEGRPRRIRSALIEHLAGELGPDQVQEDVDNVTPENVWDEANNEWKLDYQTLAGQVMEQKVNKAVEERQKERAQVRDEVRNEMIRVIQEETDQDIDETEWRKAFEIITDAEIEAVAGMSVEDLRERARERAETKGGEGDDGSGGEGGSVEGVNLEDIDPKLAEDLEPDPDAVYGFRPKADSPLSQFDVDWSDPEEVAEARRMRQAYKEEQIEPVRDRLHAEMDRARADGDYSVEDIAREVVPKRNQQRLLSYVDRGNEDEIRAAMEREGTAQEIYESVEPHVEEGNLDGLKSMLERNEKEHGRPQGPSADHQREKYQNWSRAAHGAIKSNRAMDILTGLDRIE